MRLFVAVQPPVDFLSFLARFSCGLPGARWVEVEQIHLTLSFIGETEGGLIDDLAAVLETVEFSPFSLQPAALGCFPLRRSPEVLWLGCQESNPLSELKKKVDAALRRIGHRPEKRKFFPHMTLARVRRCPAARLREYLFQHGALAWPAFTVDRFTLFSSVLNPQGARHFVEAEYFAV